MGSDRDLIIVMWYTNNLKRDWINNLKEDDQLLLLINRVFIK